MYLQLDYAEVLFCIRFRCIFHHLPTQQDAMTDNKSHGRPDTQQLANREPLWFFSIDFDRIYLRVLVERLKFVLPQSE